ncbi:shikimate dehydrogenase [Microcystis aeruginosa]|jgi:chromosome segregation ATPase|uniref:Shikimate dehydrogenase n=3 Tax=Microcystis TaxID=1125 RepID=A0A552H8M8_MICVR|nr:shikimate dehydrogenase [Microcystis aeruginosa]TRU67516.1 MAG: shikimate dehydrogenase [Microcystis viridis Mv_BB_P_19951000_S68D]TRU69709.1 MAG: shikimate dehydrogenase [Microcystis viridis Mv_BB_P_19951000_S69]TRU78507.1 MAG: shikimate dehydrogenase [Microcystis viridis Mv_BB_P_19951000_S68]TRU85751.1 MAG: shikimate dehydrogenase [Microcystis viridis Mv_BB_P_19951000_S69D]QGZ89693.1 shikimate dehydrogenase [Microcystis aeruginosa FD4]
MSNETVSYSLESVLKEIKDSIKEVNQKMDTLQQDVNQKIDTLQKDVNQKIDTLQRDVSDLKVGQAKLTEKVEGMDKRLEKVENEQYTLVKAISDLQGFRGLIVPILIGAMSAAIGAIITVAIRILFLGNNP